jgi:hypothetical protein
MQVKRDKRTTILIVLVAVLIVTLLGATAFFAKGYYDLRQNPNKVAEDETKRLVEKVGKLYQLPGDETPVVAKVEDKEKLKDQPFFKNAENGDQLLIYQGAKMAIIYREKDNKLINVGPVAMDSAPQNGQTSASVKVYNASNDQSLANNSVNKVGEIAGLNIDKEVADAKKKDLTGIIIVDVSGTKSSQAQQIADKLGGKVGALPQGEVAPTTDIAVFVGKL